MKVLANDFGICGVEQLFHAGTVKFDTDKVSNGIVLKKLPNNMYITRAVAVVGTAFSAGSLTIGTNDDIDDVIGADDITETTAGTYSKQVFVEAKSGAELKAKLTGTATAGVADIYIFFVSIPD